MRFFVPLVSLVVSSPVPTPAPAPIDAYLAEARELAQRLGAIEPQEFKRRYDRLLALGSAVRRQRTLNQEVNFALDQLRFHFSLAQVLTGYRRQYLDAGLPGRARDTHRTLRRIEREQLQRVERLERLLRGNVAP